MWISRPLSAGRCLIKRIVRILRKEIISRLSMIVFRAKVSAGFTNLRSLEFAALDLVHCSLSVLRFVFVLDIVSSRRKLVIGFCAAQIF